MLYREKELIDGWVKTVLSFILFALTVSRIQYTTHLRPSDPLNHGVSFYDPIVVELLVCVLVILLVSPAWCVFQY